MLKLNKIYHGDCLKGMKLIPDKKIDLILTDPPYGLLKTIEWDKRVNDEYIKELFRVSKNQIIFGGNYYDLPKTESWIIWYKRPFLKTMSEAEMAWTSFKIKTKVIDYTYAGNCEGYPGKLKVNYKKKSQHPTEKPKELFKILLELYSKEGDLILDPFVGAGMSMVACFELKRNYIGIDINQDYVSLTKKRLEDSKELKKEEK